MRQEHLGNARDHWKGSVHEHLRADGHLVDLHAIGMFSDGPWDPTWIAVYASLLRLAGPHVIVDANARVPNRTSWRHGYFARLAASLPPDADVLVDPDIGVNDERVNKANITPEELGPLLLGRRVVMVFDANRGRGDNKNSHAFRAAQEIVRLGAHVLAYESGKRATVLFLCRDPARLGAIAGSLSAWLGPASQRKVIAFP